MTNTPNRPPLWRAMQRRADAAMAAYHPSVTDEQLLAAEIFAVRDWLKGELPEGGAWYVLLTAEADRAERGE